MERVAVFWFRRDLRLDDNSGLSRALMRHPRVLPVFIFDPNILASLPRDDRRVVFIHRALSGMQDTLSGLGCGLWVLHADPLTAFERVTSHFEVSEVYCNRDGEPYALDRDRRVAEFLRERGIGFQSLKDQNILDRDDVLTDSGEPYRVYSAYRKKWNQVLTPADLASIDTRAHWTNLRFGPAPQPFPSLERIGFEDRGGEFPTRVLPDEALRRYASTRNMPAVPSSQMSVHLRFGTVSIRELAGRAGILSTKYLNELIWRDFFHQMLYHHPQVVDRPFRPEYEAMAWRDDEEGFQRWCLGQTGFPLVDAGMRELNATGLMHNRVRMVTASFLIKDLLIDWRRGERYFAEKLLDFDLAANNGNWQWVAGTGCDAAPYFRVFNPERQAERFDPEQVYIRRWVPELGTPDYPAAMVDHRMARQRAIEAYKAARNKGATT